MKNKLFNFFIIFLLSFSAASWAEEAGPPGGIALNKAEVPIKKSDNKVSLDLKGMDVVDVLKILASRSGMNIVVGKNVTGKVTMFLKDVELWDAFEIILLANDLAYERKGDIINVMTQRDYELRFGTRYKDNKEAKTVQLKYAKAADLLKTLSQVKTNDGKIIADENTNTVILLDLPEKIKEMEEFIKKTDLPTETRVFNLNYAQAEKLSAKIKEEPTKGVGSIKIDERTNKVAITDYPQKLEQISRIIAAFDEKTPQVLIDAQVIEINPSDLFQMGVDWDYWIDKNLRLAASMPTSGAINKLSIGTAAAGLLVKDQGQYKGIIDLLRTIGDTKILSSPRITVLNNQEAKILVGTKDAYITSTVSQSGTGTAITSQTVNFVDVGIKLFVTPTINRDGFVTMKIKPEISSSETRKVLSQNQETEIPIVTTSEAETSVTIKDGITIIIGGLRKDEKTKTVKKIPVIGDIPFFGALFRNTSDQIQKTELVILLTPHIMSGESSFTDFSEIKPREGAVARMVEGEIIVDKFSLSKEEQVLIDEYRRMIIDRINNFAKTDYPQGKKGKVNLTFIILNNGALSSEPEVLEATDPELIPFAVTAIKKSFPFLSLPQDLHKKEERFNVTLYYE